MKKAILILMCLLICGCASSAKKDKTIEDIIRSGSKEEVKEVVTALESVGEALTGQDLTEEQMEQVVKEIRNDPEAQSAVNAIVNSLEGKKPAMKYSPATGKRYSGSLDIDPETGVKLLPIEE